MYDDNNLMLTYGFNYLYITGKNSYSLQVDFVRKLGMTIIPFYQAQFESEETDGS